MVRGIRCLILVISLLIPVVASAAEKRLAVLELSDEGAKLTPFELSALTDDVRAAALVLQPYGVIVMTRESMMSMLGPDGDETLKRCTGASCEVEAGRTLGADLVVVGSVGKFAGDLEVRLKLFDTMSASLLAQRKAQGADLKTLRKALDAESPLLFGAVSPASMPATNVGAQGASSVATNGRTMEGGAAGQSSAGASVPSRARRPEFGSVSVDDAVYGPLDMVLEPKKSAVRKTMITRLEQLLAGNPQLKNRDDVLFRIADTMFEDCRGEAFAAGCFAKGIAAVRTLVREFPTYQRLDEALYYLGAGLLHQAAASADRNAGAEGATILKALLRDYPASRRTLEAQLCLGRYYIDNGDLDLAKSVYATVSTGGNEKIAWYVMFELGHIAYLSAAYDAAVSHLQQAIGASGGASGAIRNRMIDDLVLAYAAGERPGLELEARTYLESVLSAPEAAEKLSQLVRIRRGPSPGQP